MLEKRVIDLKEERAIEEFITSSCGCQQVNGGPCSSQFSAQHFHTTRAACAELSWDELNLSIMGQVRVIKTIKTEAIHILIYICR